MITNRTCILLIRLSHRRRPGDREEGGCPPAATHTSIESGGQSLHVHIFGREKGDPKAARVGVGCGA